MNQSIYRSNLFTNIAISILLVVLASIITLLLSHTVGAADAKNFNPGRIIDDAVFYNSDAINATQIQKFLESKNPNCDYNGTQSAADWGYPNITHAKLAEYKRNGTNGFTKDTGFHAPPYKCLTKYTQTTPQMEAASGYCNAIGAATRSAAKIINDVAKACGINPQVLIILLEKEQSLVTDNWPLNRQLRNATGFACPDTAPCNPAYEGFFYQVYYAARQFKVYQANPDSYNYIAGRTNRIYWHPDLSRCGSSQVYIENQATAALYIYTPYRPNQAALNNLYGTGNSCSSYGNRNFWRIFTDWFGSTRELYNYYNEDLVGTTGVIKNTSLQTGTGLKSLSINDNIYTFYSDTTTKNLRLATWSGSKWVDVPFDGPDALTRGALSTNLNVTHLEAFDFHGKPQVFYYDQTSKTLRHAYLNNSGKWSIETLDGTSQSVLKRAGDVGSAISGFAYGAGGIQLYYYDNSQKQLIHTWWTGKAWKSEALDGTSQSVLKRAGDVGSAISTTVYNGQIQLFYYHKTEGALVHTWWNDKWHTEIMDGDAGSVLGNTINAGRVIETEVFKNSLFVAYYDDANGFSGTRTSAWRLAYWASSGWIQNTLDGGDATSRSGSGVAVPLSKITLEGYDTKSLQIFYKGGSNQLSHIWVKR